MFLSFFNTSSKEEKFWNWVLKNKTKLEAFIHSDFEDYTVYNRLTNTLKKYNSLLFPEMTLGENGKVVLIITPDGMKDGILPTQKLYDSKPNLDNWIIKKFRQPNDEIGLNFDGVEYPSSDITIRTQINEKEEKVDVEIYIKNMNSEPSKHKTLAFLYLDHILGEFNTITKVGFIDFKHWNDAVTIEDGISILELRILIEKELY
ncbi:hypothetical protein [Winogradskyella thalassocola]|uniref:Uncharacterized protein n=1 Tax=Winogradskyella thalassocola TaxID=262004 RepID=A0A1G8KQH7_9FLAO|nr:hypothetical protein [Winogradskyella thalassocola]SDI45616.1 hypothetical protein SAMN04489796_11176 [Winogradskyella thalassocola]